jgi:hypothetical protein
MQDLKAGEGVFRIDFLNLKFHKNAKIRLQDITKQFFAAVYSINFMPQKFFWSFPSQPVIVVLIHKFNSSNLCEHIFLTSTF